MNKHFSIDLREYYAVHVCPVAGTYVTKHLYDFETEEFPYEIGTYARIIEVTKRCRPENHVVAAYVTYEQLIWILRDLDHEGYGVSDGPFGKIVQYFGSDDE